MKRNTPVSPPTLISLEAAKLKVGLTGVSTFMISVLQLLRDSHFLFKNKKRIHGSCSLSLNFYLLINERETETCDPVFLILNFKSKRDHRYSISRFLSIF